MQGRSNKCLVLDSETNECFFLKWKTLKIDQRKGRELDPRYYNAEEEKEFRAADAKEWKSFLDTGAVIVIPPHQAKKVDPRRIFQRAARFVHTDKNGGEGDLIAKSRMCLPGDVDPDGNKCLEEGGFRTDSPTSPQVAFHCFCSNATRRQWEICSFDVSAAYLTGDRHR